MTVAIVFLFLEGAVAVGCSFPLRSISKRGLSNAERALRLNAYPGDAYWLDSIRGWRGRASIAKAITAVGAVSLLAAFVLLFVEPREAYGHL
jgi:hypothetical protein